MLRRYPVLLRPATSFVIAIELLCAHAVLGQRSGLIRTDDRHTAQAFHRIDVLDDGMLSCHLWSFPWPVRSSRCWTSASGMAATASATANISASSTSFPCRIRSVRTRTMTDDDDAQAQLLAKVIQRLLQRRLALLRLIQQGCNFPDLTCPYQWHTQPPCRVRRLPVRLRKPYFSGRRADICASIVSTCFSTLSASPVKRAFIDLQGVRFPVLLASAPTTSPASSNSRSPTTSSVLGISIFHSVTNHTGTRCGKLTQCIQRFLRLHRFGSVPRIEFIVMTAKITTVLSSSRRKSC